MGATEAEGGSQPSPGESFSQRVPSRVLESLQSSVAKNPSAGWAASPKLL